MTNKTMFRVAIEGHDLFWQPYCGSDAVIVTRGHFKKINNQLTQKLELFPTKKTFYVTNLSKMPFDRFFNATLKSLSGAQCNSRVYVANLPISEPPLLNETVLLKLRLITYNPDGFVRHVKESNVDQNSSEPKIATKDPKYIKIFQDLHKEYGTVFQGMGLLKDYEVDLKLKEDIEFFYLP